MANSLEKTRQFTEPDVMQQARHVGLLRIGSGQLLAELSAYHRASQRMSPKDHRIQHPLLRGESLSQAAGEKNGFDATQAQANDRPLDGFGRLRQAKQGRTRHAQTLGGNGVVIRHQAHHFVHLRFLAGRAQQLQQRKKYRGNCGHGFNTLHALPNCFGEGCGHNLPLLSDGFQYAIVPGKWTR